ncbi:MAG: TIR domain-containing protein [Clostridiales bacterium]|nr:TIR domain-containing protein [Clostridiales bacterium]
MAVLKCKMCGGELDILEGSTVAKCMYCGTKQTVPKLDSEKKTTLFTRANRLRFNCEFDKASGLYESIVAEFPEEAEAYWGLVLCKYGIEYVDDPATEKKIPTCHRTSFESVLEDTDFEQTLENADPAARTVYRDEAKKIEELRQNIVEVSGKEEPYDIFICYKETDLNGERTIDSVIAQDVYTALTDKGYRVFFSRISLEDKLGQEYEPYIFAALNSAKIMLAFGTDYEYYNAVWVKNEWSRYLKLMATDRTKTLIPCYKGIDAYDMPKEFLRLQSQDMGKVGAMQDLLRGIEKILPQKPAVIKKTKEVKTVEKVVEKVVVKGAEGGADTGSLLRRAEMFLEDGDFNSANAYAEKVLDILPECAEAYLIKLCCDLKLKNKVGLGRLSVYFTENNNYKKLIRFADENLKEELNGYIAQVEVNIENARAEKAAAELSAKQKLKEKRVMNSRTKFIGCGADHIICLKIDGTVVSGGYNDYGQCDVSDWRDIIAICAGHYHTVGLKYNGTVVAIGLNSVGQCDVSDWRDIAAISADWGHTVGLKKDGTVVAVGINKDGRCDISDWRDIVAVSAAWDHTVGLKKDGTVVAVGYNKDGRCDVSDWRDIVAISAGGDHTVGLKSDGTAVAVGGNKCGQCDVSDWHDVFAISAGYGYTVGLKLDGTVVAVGDNSKGQCNISDWRDMVAILAGKTCTVGLKSDGKVIFAGRCPSLSDVEAPKLFNSIDTLVDERNQAIQKRKAELRKKYGPKIELLQEEKAQLEQELPNVKGLFKAKAKKQIEDRLAQIDKQLKEINKEIN